MVQISTLLSIVASVSAASATTNHPSPGALVGRDAQQGGVAEIYRRLLDSRTELQVRDKVVEVPEQELQEILNKLAELQDDVEGLLAKAGKGHGSAVEVNSGEKPQGKAKLEGGNGNQAASKAEDTFAGLKNTLKEGGPSPDALKKLKSMGEFGEASTGLQENTGMSEPNSSKGPASNGSSDAASSNDKQEDEGDEEDDTTSTITLTSTSTKRVTVTAATMHTVTATAESQATDAPDADEDGDESESEEDDDSVDAAPLLKVAIEEGPEGEEVNSKAVLESAHIAPASTDTPAPDQEEDAGSDTEDEDDTPLASGANPKVKAVDTSSETGSQPRQTSTSSSTMTGDAPPAAVTDTAPSSKPSVPETPSTLATSPEEIATPAPGSSPSSDGAVPLIDINLKNVASSTTDSPDKPAQVSSSPTSDSDVKTKSEEESDIEATVVVTETDGAKPSEPDVVQVPSDTGSDAEATPGKQTSTGFKTLIRFSE